HTETPERGICAGICPSGDARCPQGLRQNPVASPPLPLPTFGPSIANTPPAQWVARERHSETI
ncbi:hypothetical protein NQZ68_032048, partial [Dissostichus eleginoides]